MVLAYFKGYSHSNRTYHGFSLSSSVPPVLPRPPVPASTVAPVFSAASASLLSFTFRAQDLGDSLGFRVEDVELV